MFGGTNSLTQPQQGNNNIFGAPQQQNSIQLNVPSSGNSLFGSSLQQQQQQQPTQPGGIFSATVQQQPQQQPSLFSGLGSVAQNQQPIGGSVFGAPQQQSQSSGIPSATPLWQPGNSLTPREKTIPEQMQVVLEKWSPESSKCLFQHYFYNSVQAEHVPYYGPAPGEDERKWDEALSKKPAEGSIPVLCKGFYALGNRLSVQLQAVTALQTRLHEINNSLTAMLQNHDLEISIRAVDAKRRHVALSQRCLQLATKVQILRNRGYAMDSAEEILKKKLTELEKSVFDPSLSGRQEEIWARMVGVRERARFLQEETDKVGGSIRQGSSETIDDELMRKTKKILGDYDLQISHLNREIEEICKEYTEWENSSSRSR